MPNPRTSINGTGAHLSVYHESPHYRAELETDLLELLDEYEQRYGRGSLAAFLRRRALNKTNAPGGVAGS